MNLCSASRKVLSVVAVASTLAIGCSDSVPAPRVPTPSVEAPKDPRKVDHATAFKGWSDDDLVRTLGKEIKSKDIVHHVDTSPKPSLWVNEESWKDASLGRRANCASLVWERCFRGKPGDSPLPVLEVGTKKQIATYSRDGGLVDAK